MKTIFEISLNNVLKHEGWYSNLPEDRGGETFRGISRKHFPDWSGWKTIDEIKQLNNWQIKLQTNGLLAEKVEKFYKKNFWDKFNGDKITSLCIVQKMLDISINMGISRASKFLQQGLNVLNKNQQLYNDLTVDGIVGNQTLSAINIIISRQESKLLHNIISILQGAKYIDIMQNDPTQEIFARGWLKRVKILMEEE